jgi:ribosomal protein L23
MNTYTLNVDNKHNKQQIIEQIAVSNRFDISVVKDTNKPRQRRSDKNNKELSASHILEKRQGPS